MSGRVSAMFTGLVARERESSPRHSRRTSLNTRLIFSLSLSQGSGCGEQYRDEGNIGEGERHVDRHR